MTDEARQQELAAIRLEQDRLRAQMTRLEQRIAALALPVFVQEKLAETLPVIEPVAPASAKPPVEMPPPLPLYELAPVLPVAPIAAGASSPEPPPPVPIVPRDSLEVQIGTTWLVRAGVVLLLTSLAFLGSYLYQHVVPRLGALPKVALLYLASGALVGAGAWLERRRTQEPEDLPKSESKLHQYAQVVLAGGLAAVYYVTYAAHWNPHLRVVENPLLAGALLLGWTAFMVHLAHRRASETLATFAILLAYYTSAINEIAAFTLFSNLALTVAAVWLLRRHLWRVFPFASLLATYGSYGFWRYFHVYSAFRLGAGVPTSAVGSGGLWIDGTFLLIYWLLFTWVTFAPGKKTVARVHEAIFAGINNGGFFALSTWALLTDHPDDFWKWALGFGAVLLGLAEVGRRLREPLDERTQGTYHSGGIVLVTWGLLAYFTGWQLSLTMAVESTTLALGAVRRRSRLFLFASLAVGFLSVLELSEPTTGGSTAIAWMVGLAGGAFLVFNAWWSRRASNALVSTEADIASTPPWRSLLQVAPAIFNGFGCVTWGQMVLVNVPISAHAAPSLAVASLLITALAQGIRLGSLAIYAQGFLLLAVPAWACSRELHFDVPGTVPLWSPLLMLGCVLATGHWWQSRTWKTLLAAPGWVVIASLDAVFAICILARWLQPAWSAPAELWVGEGAALSVLLLGYGIATRYGSLAASGQYFLGSSILVSATVYAHSWDGRYSEPLLAVAPILGALAVVAVLTTRASQGQWPSWLGNRVIWAGCYEALATALLLAWGCRYFPRPEAFSLFCGVAGLWFIAADFWSNRRWLYWSGALFVTALGIYWISDDLREEAYWQHWFGIAIIAGLQQVGRRHLPPGHFPKPAQSALIVAATLVAWTWVTAWMHLYAAAGIFTVAAGWSLFSLVVFAAGFWWRESTYRWLGLTVLACTLARIVLYDIWQLDSLGRILSSFALGLVLLGIAFAYIKFQKQLRNWF